MLSDVRKGSWAKAYWLVELEKTSEKIYILEALEEIMHAKILILAHRAHFWFSKENIWIM